MFGSLDYEGQPVAYPDLCAVMIMITACITNLSLLLQILKLKVY